MKRKWIAAAALAALFSSGAWAQMGPGMMGGYGAGGYYGMGPGMMGGYGMGPGMMGGYGTGGYGMGPGMMGGYGRGGYGYGYRALNLTDEQRTKIATIEEEFSRTQWDLMDKMHDQHHDLWGADESAARKAYQAMADTRKVMFESSLDARKRIDSVLTDEQRKQVQRGWRGR